jgi:hypothetical protein
MLRLGGQAGGASEPPSVAFAQACGDGAEDTTAGFAAVIVVGAKVDNLAVFAFGSRDEGGKFGASPSTFVGGSNPLLYKHHRGEWPFCPSYSAEKAIVRLGLCNSIRAC